MCRPGAGPTLLIRVFTGPARSSRPLGVRTSRRSEPCSSMKPLVLAILLSLPARPVSADWRFEAETGAVCTSNLSNSDRGSDEQPDWAWNTQVRATDGFQLTRDLRLSVSGDLVSHVWHEYNAFNEIAPGLAGLLRYRFGLGSQAPWIALEQSLHYAAFD